MRLLNDEQAVLLEAAEKARYKTEIVHLVPACESLIAAYDEFAQVMFDISLCWSTTGWRLGTSWCAYEKRDGECWCSDWRAAVFVARSFSASLCFRAG